MVESWRPNDQCNFWDPNRHKYESVQWKEEQFVRKI